MTMSVGRVDDVMTPFIGKAIPGSEDLRKSSIIYDFARCWAVGWSSGASKADRMMAT
jgi:hypothetical protein